MLRSQNDLVNNIGGKIGYQVRDGWAIFTENIIATKNIRFVDMQLVGLDMSKYSDYDLLPISADMAAKLVMDAYNILKGQLPADKRVDSVAEENTKR